MTRQEVAVARSHIEAWKAVASGPHDHVLVLEDDVWFRPRAAAAIDRGWHAAWERRRAEGGPHLLYLSYADAGKSAERADVCRALFRPLRGLWFLSGYVLSREGAAMLLRAMPVVGPVDMWMNFRFDTLGALALASPAILQRVDGGSDNAHSILPYLSRAGIVDAHLAPVPARARANPVLAWTACGERDGLAMALSMLGLRVRAFDGDEPPIHAADLPALLDAFDALVDAPSRKRPYPTPSAGRTSGSSSKDIHPPSLASRPTGFPRPGPSYCRLSALAPVGGDRSAPCSGSNHLPKASPSVPPDAGGSSGTTG